MSHDPQSPTDAADYYADDGEFYEDGDDCWECGGEEGCDDPLCWRTCPSCKGTGSLP